MASTPAQNSPLVPSSSPKYIANANVASEPQTFPHHPAPAPPRPQCYNNNISPEAAHPRDRLIAQPHDSKQPLSSQPLISTSDKSSIEDILDRLRSLNSSIADVADAVMERELKSRRIGMGKGVKIRDLSPLMRMAVYERDQTEGNMIEAENTFNHAILYDIIVGFIYDIIEGEKMEEISHGYKKFREDIEKVRNTEAFADAQNWIRIAGRLVESPPSATWDDLVEELMEKINHRFWQIGEYVPRARRRNVIKQETGRQYFPEIIKNAFAISMDMYAGISSEQLELTIGKEGLDRDPLEVEMSEDLTRVTSAPQTSGYGNRVIRGNCSLGLASKLDDGARKIYLKPIVAYS